MKKILEIIVRFFAVFVYYLIVCPLLYSILLIIHPFNTNKDLTYKNVFKSDFIATDPDEIAYLNSGEKYHSYKSAWDFLIDKKTWYVK